MNRFSGASGYVLMTEEELKQLKLDAFKSGMRIAAEIVKGVQNKRVYHGAEDCQTTSIELATRYDFEQAILTDCESRTELP